jgi:hypothetical protein
VPSADVGDDLPGKLVDSPQKLIASWYGEACRRCLAMLFEPSPAFVSR